MHIMRVGSVWGGGERKGVKDDAEMVDDGGDRCVGCSSCPVGEEGCPVGEDEGEQQVEVDQELFSRLLRRVTLADARLYSKMSYLGILAYIIPKIKPRYLLRYNLRLVTSSLEEKEKSMNTMKALNSEESKSTDISHEKSLSEDNKPSSAESDGKTSNRPKLKGRAIRPAAAYQIVASAASYLQSRAQGIFPFQNAKKDCAGNSSSVSSGARENTMISVSDEASFVATTSSVTVMVAAEEETKQAVAKELNSSQSSPCEWFICDDDQSFTRYIVIQGSETFASWQANLLFEPVKFEGFDIHVHRGIYEAAKGMYNQILPYVQGHLQLHGKSASFRFTGHSLGGSLAMLVNLMLLRRGEVPASSLLPVITFGAPCIMCGGDELLHQLGLPSTHVQSITMHRDIVPRAFSCHYPDHVANILKAINEKFRAHPCLANQKLLYGPMGKLIILQPDERFSPPHDLLPAGSGLYLFGDSSSIDPRDSRRLLRAALLAFYNTPHPLEILSDRSAYGANGMIYRDHDMNSYLKSVRAVIRQELKQRRDIKRRRRQVLPWWPLGLAGESDRRAVAHSLNGGENWKQQFRFDGLLHGGRETLSLLGSIVATHHAGLLVVLLFPARLLVLGALSTFGLFRQ